MIKRITAWLRSKRERLHTLRLEYLKATERKHYSEFLECTDAGKDLGRMAAFKRAYANDAAAAVGEGHAAVLEARRDAIMYGEQSQQEYEAADFHYAAYIEARETYRELTNT
jgi:hypothetical protein